MHLDPLAEKCEEFKRVIGEDGGVVEKSTGDVKKDTLKLIVKIDKKDEEEVILGWIW